MSVALPGPGTRPLRGVALSLALLSVVAFWPPALDRWVLPKVLVLGVAALFAVFPAPTGRLPRWLVLGVVGAVALLIVAALVGAQPVAALFGRWPRYEGLVTATAYLVALWLGARLLGPASGVRDARMLDRMLAVVATALALVSILEALGVRPLASDLERPGALLGNATDQGAVAAALAVVLLARLLRARPTTRLETVLLGAAASLAALTVLLSGSRAALLALLAGAAVATALAPLARRTRVILAAATLLPVAALAFLLPTIGTRLLGSADSVADRLLIWREALRVFAAHPVVGTGPSGFLDAVAAVHDVRWFTSESDAAVLDSPHDVLLQALVVGGPLGLVLVVTGLVAAVVALVRRYRAAGPERRAVIVPTGLGAGVLVLVLLTHVSAPATMIPAALFAGAALAIPRPRPRPEAVPVRLGFAAAVIVWLTLVSFTLAGESALAAGVVATREGRLDDADADFESAVALRLWDADTPVIAAEALTERLDSGDRSALADATYWAQRAHTVAPDSLAVGKAEVVAAIAGQDLKRADMLLDQLRGLYPLDPWIAFRAGAVDVGRGQFDEGEQLLKLAITLDPQRPDPWLTLAFLYDQQGDAAAAADAQAHAAALGG